MTEPEPTGCVDLFLRAFLGMALLIAALIVLI